MNDERQIYIPPSFIEIYKNPTTGRVQPSRLWLEDRHELCDDFAQLLSQQAHQKILELGITRADALERIARGLDTDPAPLDLSEEEVTWVKHRVEELLPTSFRSR